MIVEPLPLPSLKPSSRDVSRLLQHQSPHLTRTMNPSVASNNEDSTKLCFVHRKSSNSPTKAYVWPAMFYASWTEVLDANTSASTNPLPMSDTASATTTTTNANSDPVFSVPISKRLERLICDRLYENAANLAISESTTANTSSTNSKVIVRFLGVSEEETPMMEWNTFFQEIDPSQDLFHTFFGSFFSQVLTECTKPSIYEEQPNWYLQFMKGMDEAMSISRGRRVETLTGVAKKQQREQQQQQQRRRGPFQSPIHGMETPPHKTRHSKEEVFVSASEKTPTHSNKLHDESEITGRKAESKTGLSTVQVAGLEQRGLDFSGTTPSTKNVKDEPRTSFTVQDARKPKAKRKANRKMSQSSSQAPFVTPVLSTRRGGRRLNKTTLNTDTNQCNDRDDFYTFQTLIPILLKEGWNYGYASSQLKTYVYERPNTKGEKGGKYLEDYFYEESEVIDFCRQSNYKEKYYERTDNFCITPSPTQKRQKV